MDTEVLCIYCNKPWSEQMLDILGFADCSYTPECVTAQFHNAITIKCEHCNKIVYKKELEIMAATYTEKQWENFYN